MKNELLKLDLLFDSMSEQEQELAIENQLPYFFSKANLFLKMGHEKYRLADYFKRPPAETSNEELEILKVGCEQVIEGKGLFSSNPFVNIDVAGFSSLMRLFHFKAVTRKTKHLIEFEEKKGALDCITFIHIVDNRKTTLFNFCEY
jgi:hypothetical protein